jgi:DNA invertase Pin-like site-specific DNA recombinase
MGVFDVKKPVSESMRHKLAGLLGYETFPDMIIPMKIAYSRVSTDEQSLDLQQDELKRAGCERFFSDIASGGKFDRPGLNDALTFLREGDTLVVWRLDRLGRSLKELIATASSLQERGIGFQSLRENIDTTTPGGKLVFHIFGSLAEFERDLIRERTKAGLVSARARGRLGGRPKSLDPAKAKIAASLLASRDSSVAEICRSLGVSKATLYRHARACSA